MAVMRPPRTPLMVFSAPSAGPGSAFSMASLALDDHAVIVLAMVAVDEKSQELEEQASAAFVKHLADAALQR